MLEGVIKEIIEILVNVKVIKPKHALLSIDEDLRVREAEVSIKSLSELTNRKELKISAIDAASLTLYVGFSELALASATYVGTNTFKAIPSYNIVDSSHNVPPIMGSFVSLENLRLITDKYIKMGVKYLDDPELPEDALAHDVRISLESYMINEAALLNDSDLILIDGPLEYPLRHPKEGSIWNDEIALLNYERVESVRRALKRGIVPASIVKRISNSRYLSHILSLELPDANLIPYLVKRVNVSSPFYIGPIVVESTSESLVKHLYYVVVPLNSYVSSYTAFRVELPAEAESRSEYSIEDILASIIRNTVNYGLHLPYKLMQADRISKKLVIRLASIIEGVSRMKGSSLIRGVVYD